MGNNYLLEQLFMRVFASAVIAATAYARTDEFWTGTNIGGWMVNEAWITPSLFYRFLGKKHSDGIGQDSYTLCEVLGPEAGNKLMKAHWDSWVQESHFAELASRGVEIV